MTDAAAPASAPVAPAFANGRGLQRAAPLWLWAALLVAAALAVQGGAVWGGALPGNDDIMRLLQLRALEAGQPLHDVSQPRMLSPEGGALHWSRLPDLGLLALEGVFGLALSETMAERAAVFAWPLLLLTLLCAGLARAVRALGGGAGAAAGAVLCFALSSGLYQFQPGRIDHHGLVAALIVWSAALLLPLPPGGGRRTAALAALCAVAALSVAVEALPWTAALVAAAGARWLLGPDTARRGRQLEACGLSLAASAAALFVLDAPGPDWAARDVCDAYGNGHLAALLAGGGLLAALDRFAGRRGIAARTMLAAAAAGLTAAAAFAAAPHCFGNPYGGLGPLAAEHWLANVQEARGAAALLRADPAKLLFDGGVILGALAACALGWREAVRAGQTSAPGDAGQRRAAWLILGGLLLLGALLTAWQVRSVLFAHAFAAVPAALLVERQARRWRQRRGAPALLAAGAALLFATPLGWGHARTLLQPAATEAAIADSAAACASAEGVARAGGAALGPDVRVLAPVDLSAPLLLHTNAQSSTGPYHRNAGGIEETLATLLSAPDAAGTRIARAGYTHLAWCRGSGEARQLAAAAPGSLAAQLEGGAPPAWLAPLAAPAEASPERVGAALYAVRPIDAAAR